MRLSLLEDAVREAAKLSLVHVADEGRGQGDLRQLASLLPVRRLELTDLRVALAVKRSLCLELLAEAGELVGVVGQSDHLAGRVAWSSVGARARALGGEREGHAVWREMRGSEASPFCVCEAQRVGTCPWMIGVDGGQIDAN